MLSRVADNLYWMRRYVERADQIARVVGVNLELAFDRSPGDVARLWGRLLTGALVGTDGDPECKARQRPSH